MAGRQVVLTFDLDDRSVEGEAIGYAAKACEVDVAAILDAVGGTTKRKPKDALQLRNTRDKVRN